MCLGSLFLVSPFGITHSLGEEFNAFCSLPLAVWYCLGSLEQAVSTCVAGHAEGQDAEA